MPKFKLLTCSLVILFASVISVVTQVREEISADGSQCELNIRGIENVMREASKLDERVFILSFRANTERKGVDWARLRYARFVITEFRGFPDDQITIAVGELSKGDHGYLEFWVGTKSSLIVYLPKNQQPCLSVGNF